VLALETTAQKRIKLKPSSPPPRCHNLLGH
jgi:hypothetical protein